MGALEIWATVVIAIQLLAAGVSLSDMNDGGDKARQGCLTAMVQAAIALAGTLCILAELGAL